MVIVTDPFDVVCPTCEAEIGEPCRGKSGRIVDFHRARQIDPSDEIVDDEIVSAIVDDLVNS